ncbi:condensation domain-containing protein, partial [Nocardia sp. CNY236]|uniref:condensation domain-containing protein n=1 Tax=Nocardia sp. CNY236 TaxID=1169152 RepID=UPI0005679003
MDQPAGRSLHLPLTAAQCEIWIAQELNPQSTDFRIGDYIEIVGFVDSSLIESATRQVVSEAESIRARFTRSDGNVYQYVEDVSDWIFHVVDLTASPDPAAGASQWISKEIGRPMLPENGRLFNFALLKLQSDRFIWYHSYHHIVIDGTGFSLVARRVAEIYNARVAGVEPPNHGFGSLRELVSEDEAYHASESYASDRAYWVERLTDMPEAVRFVGTTEGAGRPVIRWTKSITAAGTNTLKILSDQCGSHYPALLITATAILLHRTTGEQDIVLGLPVPARFSAKMKRTPGMVANVVPLRILVRPGSSIAELVNTVGREIGEAVWHQRYRGENIARDLRLKGGLDDLFGVIVNFVGFDYGFDFSGHEISVHNVSVGRVDDVAFVIHNGSDSSGTRIDLLASGHMHDEQTTNGHLERFMRLVQALASGIGPDVRVGAIDLLGETERQLVLKAWNDTAVPMR